MILMRENPFRGPLEGVGPEMATNEASAIWTQNCQFSGPTPSNGLNNGFSRIKIIKSKRHIKNRYIGNFMYMIFCILYSVLFVVSLCAWVLLQLCRLGYGEGRRESHPPPPTPHCSLQLWRYSFGYGGGALIKFTLPLTTPPPP